MSKTANAIAAVNLFAIAALTSCPWFALLGAGFLVAAVLVTVADVVTMKR